MTPPIALDVPSTTAADTSLVPAASSTNDLGEAIAELATKLHAATYQLLVLLREFDARRGWNDGFLSCAHWLHWRTGIDLGACREKVRVARALAALPLTSMTMEAGQVSYAKVRAITRVATPENERRLVDLALAGTAAQVERVVRAWRRADLAEERAHENQRHLRRHLTTWVDDDGMVVIRGRLSPEVGAVVQRALEVAADMLRGEGVGVPPAATLEEDVTPTQRRADALGRLAEVALTASLDRGSSGDRYQVVLHVEQGATESSAIAMGGVIEMDGVPVCVSAETSRRLACDAAVIEMAHDASRTPLDVGRRTRPIPSAIRRALDARDRHCRFPGCTSRRCDAHHVEHWMDGGATSLSNLVLLCRRHHRAIHEGGYGVSMDRDGATVFRRPDGSGIEAAPRMPLTPGDLQRPAAPRRLPTWDGTPLDVAWAVDMLRSRQGPTTVG
ncbi:MAG: DUF222 domain-containing protein [Vicinamibacterales bacterium]